MDVKNYLQGIFAVYFMMLASTFANHLCTRGCASATADPKTLVAARIEAVKQKILDKLRMDKIPVITKPKRPVPRILLDNEDRGLYSSLFLNDQPMTSTLQDDNDYGMDEFYARDGPMIVFAVPVSLAECQAKGSSLAACFSFTLPATLRKKIVESADLYFHTKRATMLKNAKLTIKELEYDPDARIHNLQDVKDGWRNLSVVNFVNRWSSRAFPRNGNLHVLCDGCMGEASNLISMESELAPFLIIRTENKPASRNRRGIDCSPGSSGCCRETLFVNFTEIGWDTWIIEPNGGYYANYCRGSCNSGLHLPVFAHTAVMQINTQETTFRKQPRAEVSGCCAPTRMGGINLLFYDADGGIHRSTLPNMQVESCGCA